MAKIANKSTPAKKAVHKTFHKHVAEDPATPSLEPASQTIQPASETIIQPVIQPEPIATPASPQTQPIEENIAPASVTTPPAAVDATPNVINGAPTTDDTKSATAVLGEPTPTPAPGEQTIPEPQSTLPINNVEESKFKKPIILIAIIAIILLALASGYFLYSKKLTSAGQKPQPAPLSQTSQASPEASKQTLNQADWTLEILNGSTRKGAAAAFAEKLTAKGYQVIKTGNAPEDAATSQVFFADSKKDQADLFLEDIADELPNPTNSGSLDDSTASARIIIGEE